MATFQEAIISCIQVKYADFKGRASRSEYWYFILFHILASLVAGLLDKMIFNRAEGIISLIVNLGLLIPTFAVAFRRFHDIGKSGWWITLTSIILGMIYGAFYALTLSNYSNTGMILPVLGVIYLMIIIGLIIMLFKKGDPLANKYGDVPI